MNKLKSRKFWIAIVSGLLLVLNDQLGWGMSKETIIGFVTIVVSYLIAEGAADTAGALRK